MAHRLSSLAFCLAVVGLLPACAASSAATGPGPRVASSTAPSAGSPDPSSSGSTNKVGGLNPITFPLEACPHAGGGPTVVALFDRACDGGDMNGCHEAFVRYACGEGVARDMRKASERADRACTRGFAASCGNAGISLLSLPDATAAELARGVAALKKGCDANEVPACNNLATAMMQGVGMARDEAAAAAVFAKLCDANNAPSCGNLGYLRMTGVGIAKDVALGMALAKKGCDAGDANSCNMVGFGYLNATNADAGDAVLASTFFQRACNAGLAAACDNLGQLYADGKGVDGDMRKAEGLFRRACDGGNAAACTHLALVLTQKDAPAAAAPSWHYEPAATKY